MNDRFYLILRFHLYGLSFVSAGLGFLGGGLLYKLSNHIEGAILPGLLLLSVGFILYAIGLILRNELG